MQLIRQPRPQVSKQTVMNTSSSQKSKLIYFDNAATTFPKPEGVTVAMLDYMTRVGGNPGRSGHSRSTQAGELVFTCRELLAKMYGVKNIMKVIFTQNATEALNLAILGLLKKGDHAVTTSMEHNSVIRPLKEFENKGLISLHVLQCDKHGRVGLDELENALSEKTALVVVNHVSNAFGTAQDLRAISARCKQRNVPLLVDCAQSGGLLDIDLARDGIDMLAVAGHKGLYGPPGTGALIISDDFDAGRIEPRKYGGTGSFSEHMTQPLFLPDRFECGTLNAAGIAGLTEGISFINSLGGPEAFRRHESGLRARFSAQCKNEIDTFVEYVSADDIAAGTISFNLAGVSPSEVAERLADDFSVMCRAGLHCAPLAHQTMGTFPDGTVRFSFGMFNTIDEIKVAVEALKEISIS